MQESHTTIEAGQAVAVRDEPWIVLGTDRFDAVHVVHLRGTGESNRDELRSLVHPFDSIHRTARSTPLRHVSRRRVLAAAACAVANAAPWDECWTAASAQIDLRAWQLQPALAAINGATRILLADHVGLGKTIQATLIVTELWARRLASRVLVLTPASLRDQWAAEMRARFGLSPAIFDQAALNIVVNALPVGVNPWLTAPLIVSSIDLVKRPEVRTAIERVAFDVLIVDEAHHVTPGTDRGALVADLAARTPWVVLVTATPHSGDDAAFAFLQRIGAHDGEPPLMFRRRRPPTATRAARRSRTALITPTDAERALLREISAYVRAIRRSRARSAGALLVASVIARRSSSCAEAAGRTVRRRIALLTRDAEPESQPCLPWEDADAIDAELDDTILSVAGLANLRQEVEWLGRIADFADRASSDSSKVATIRRLLMRTSEHLLVFTEYRDVAEHVTAGLRDITTAAALHGGLSPRERQAIVDSFNGGHLRVVVATDAAGEGLNLHHRCRFVVNLELPWTPRRLEQRIGRVDRLGQTKRVHALHLVHRHSFEGTVVARLERRRAVTEARTTDVALTEHETAVSVRRQLRLAMTTARTASSHVAVYASRPRIRMSDPSTVLVYSATAVDGNGRIVRTLAVPLSVVARHTRAQRSLTRAQVRRLLRDGAVTAAVHADLSRQIVELPSGLTRLASALDRRCAACLAAMESHRGKGMWQASLFDPDAERVAQLQAAALHEMRTHLQRMRSSVIALSTIRLSEPQLIAAWIGN